MDDTREPRKQARLSGFPLQMAIENLVRRTEVRHRWAVESKEHPWTHPPGYESCEYVDLVLRRGNCRLVLECKKTSKPEEPWVFFAPDPEHSTFEAWGYRSTREGERGSVHLRVDPESVVSSYCQYRRAKESEGTLERIGAKLVSAIEAIALETSWVKASRAPGAISLFLPVVVTNTPLWLLRFDPGAVSLETGEPTDERLERVKLLRFQKPLAAPTWGKGRVVEALTEHAIAAERTLLVVNAASFEECLNNIEVSIRE